MTPKSPERDFTAVRIKISLYLLPFQGVGGRDINNK